MIALISIYRAISQYIDYRDRPRVTESLTYSIYSKTWIYSVTNKDLPIIDSVSVSYRSFSAGSGIGQTRPIQIPYCACTILCN